MDTRALLCSGHEQNKTERVRLRVTIGNPFTEQRNRVPSSPIHGGWGKCDNVPSIWGVQHTPDPHRGQAAEVH
jgi:hypothetical protein